MHHVASLGFVGIDPNELLWRILDQSLDCIKVLGLDGTLEYMNPNGRAAMEIDDFAPVSGLPLPELWSEEGRGRLQAAILRSASGQNDRFEAFCPTAKGAPRWWEVSTSPICDAHGTPSHILCTSRDLSWWHERQRERQAATDKISPAGELTHRTRNQLSIVNALTRLSLGGDPYAGRDRLIERIGAVSAAIEVIAEGGGSVAAGKLVSRVLGPVQFEPRFRLHPTPDTKMGNEIARTVALILGELVSNTCAHGALSGKGGMAELRVKMAGDLLSFAWTETLERPPAFPLATGTGIRLIERLSAMLAEPAKVTWHDAGLDVTFAVNPAEVANA